jgi:serine/threonine protein kinase
MGAKLATPSTNLLALPEGTELVGDYRIRRVLGAGGFGITYLADERALGRVVTIKEYFPAEFAARRETNALPRSRNVTEEYKWGLERFLEEAQTLARFDHPNVVRVHRYFRANNTGYMVLKFEEGGSFKAWLKGLKRPPLQTELDRMLAPLLDALELIHKADFLHRDIAPDNIMVRKDGSPVLIDFGSARGALASQSRTVSALVKPGYSPYEQYATSGANQGPWTDIYALGATLYHAITGKRPPDAPSRVVKDEYVPAREAAPGAYRTTFLDAIDQALRIEVGQRPQRVADWRGPLLAPEPRRKRAPAAKEQPTSTTLLGRLSAAGEPELEPDVPRALAKGEAEVAAEPARPAAGEIVAAAAVPAGLVPSPPDAPQRKGQFLDFLDGLRRRPAVQKPQPAAEPTAQPAPKVGELAAFAGAAPTKPVESIEPTSTATMTTTAALPPPPPVLQRERTRRQRSWGRSARLWTTGVFRVAMALIVSGLAVSYEQRVRHLAPDGARAAAGKRQAATPSMQLAAHRGAVTAVASGLDDQWIVSAGADSAVRVWQASTGKLLRTIELAEGAPSAFAVDNRRALVGHQDGTVVLWDLESATRVATFRPGAGSVTGPVTAVAFQGERLVAVRQDGAVALLDAAAPDTPTVLLTAQASGGHMIAAAHGRGLLVSAGFDRTVRLWRGTEPELVRAWRLTGDSAAIAIAPDGGYMACGSAGGVVAYQPRPALRGPASYVAQRFKAHDGRITALAVAGTGLLASAGADGSLKLWTLHPGRIARALDGGVVQSLAFTRDGRRLLSGGKDGVIRVWPVTLGPVSGAT